MRNNSKKNVLITILVAIITGVSLFGLYSSYRKSPILPQDIKSLLYYDYELIEYKHNSAFRDGGQTFMLIHPKDNYYEDQVSQFNKFEWGVMDNYALLEFPIKYIDLSDIESYKKVENNDFIHFYYVDNNKMNLYVFLMEDEQIALFFKLR